jgi:hypothetical protein
MGFKFKNILSTFIAITLIVTTSTSYAITEEGRHDVSQENGSLNLDQNAIEQMAQEVILKDSHQLTFPGMAFSGLSEEKQQEIISRYEQEIEKLKNDELDHDIAKLVQEHDVNPTMTTPKLQQKVILKLADRLRRAVNDSLSHNSATYRAIITKEIDQYFFQLAASTPSLTEKLKSKLQQNNPETFENDIMELLGRGFAYAANKSLESQKKGEDNFTSHQYTALAIKHYQAAVAFAALNKGSVYNRNHYSLTIDGIAMMVLLVSASSLFSTTNHHNLPLALSFIALTITTFISYGINLSQRDLGIANEPVHRAIFTNKLDLTQKGRELMRFFNYAATVRMNYGKNNILNTLVYSGVRVNKSEQSTGEDFVLAVQTASCKLNLEKLLD